MSIATARIQPAFFASANTLTLAPKLLGQRLVHLYQGKRLSGLITEVEAYLPDDPASHSYRGPTPRTKAMFDLPGTIYVYRSYGIHTCLNIVTSPEGVGGAVLIRSLWPQEGIATMQQHRQRRKLAELTNGPGKLTQALGITMNQYGHSLFDSNVWLETANTPNDKEIIKTPRIGISQAKELPYRFVWQHEFSDIN